MARVGTILSRVRKVINDANSTRFSDAYLLRLLNEALNDIAQTGLFKTVGPISLVNGTNEYALPEDLIFLRGALFDCENIDLVSVHEAPLKYGESWESRYSLTPEAILFGGVDNTTVSLYPYYTDDPDLITCCGSVAAVSSNIQLWLQGDKGTLDAGGSPALPLGLVSTWQDQSPYERHAVAQEDNYLSHDEAGVDLMPVVAFDADSESGNIEGVMVADSALGLQTTQQNYSMWFVWRKTNAGTPGIALDQTIFNIVNSENTDDRLSVVAFHLPGFGGGDALETYRLHINVGGSSADLDSDVVPLVLVEGFDVFDWTIFGVINVFEEGEWKQKFRFSFYPDSLTVNTLPDIDLSSFNQTIFGGFPSHSPGDEAGNAFKVAEILVLSGEVDDTKAELIEGYLAHKWSLESHLPEGHTYKSTPPTESIE